MVRLASAIVSCLLCNLPGNSLAVRLQDEPRGKYSLAEDTPDEWTAFDIFSAPDGAMADAFREATINDHQDDYYSDDTEIRESQSVLTGKVLKAWGKHGNSWFQAKDDLLFSQVRSPFLDSQVLSDPPDEQKLHKMVRLLKLRSKFICVEVLGQADADPYIDCLFDEQKKAKCVPLTTMEMPECCAMALGSVTMLSDLDFTVMCTPTSPSGEASFAANRAAAGKEISGAEELTRRVQDKTGKFPGQLFDTNFYANTLAYGDKLLRCPCSYDAARSVNLGLYAFARGVFAIAKRMDHLSCEGGPDMRNSYVLQENGLTPLASIMRRGISTRRSMYNLTSGMLLDKVDKIFRGLTRVLEHKACEEKTKRLEICNLHTDTLEKVIRKVEAEAYVDTDRVRTGIYYNLSRQAVDELDKPGEQEFCFLAPIALIFANEAYWTKGAISDVVFQQNSLSALEGFESILMNIGYTLEHVVHEFHKGSEHDEGSPVRMCNYGDGIIKFGKYMARVGKTAAKMGMVFDSKHVLLHDYLRKAQDVLRMKKFGAEQEAKGDKLGLPKQYIEAYQWLVRDLGGGSEAKGECRLLGDLLTASSNAVADLYRKFGTEVFSQAGKTCSLRPQA
eukprot:TRINITY_DN26594_c0_g2_i1.p1 TRINITY_DN26594_c0_g2~~TRINITY_DN26594_c0_g2_i1.p1  ORF type:complete len:617 (+),score=98.36 TRINITY_DN26594_c0_g2_i1:81-1931(+)